MAIHNYQLFFITKKSRKDDILNFLQNHPNVAARLGLDNVIGNEVVKITTTSPPNEGSSAQVLGVAAFITSGQRSFWVNIKNRLPMAWRSDVDGAIRSVDNMLDFDEWLAGLTVSLYRILPNV